MPKKLVIVESPAKAKTISKILGGDYVVKASLGHVRDLPEGGMGVDCKNNFAPRYVLMKDKEKVVDDLKRAARQCDALYLASDPDREGEAIAWHLSEVLSPVMKGKPVYRVRYNEVTPRAVRAAFENPGEIDQSRVDAQQARRILDRIVGYRVSRLLWQHLNKWTLSAGRVQSVALRLLCEREKKIQAFIPEAYWILSAEVARHDAEKEPFTVRLARIDDAKADIKSEEAANAALGELQGHGMRVADIIRREITRRPLPPFITSTLQQAASSVCGFPPGRTMSIAQKLYEGIDLGKGGPVGLITYMRTDSVNLSRDALEEVRQFIGSEYGSDFLPGKPNFYRGRRGSQEAHEAIRPTDVTRTPDSLAHILDPQALKLYDLIWRRFVACQMSAARIERLTVVAAAPEPRDASAHDYAFTATASQVLFQGFLKVMALDIRRFRDPDKEGPENPEEEVDETIVDRLPPLAVGDALDVLKWNSEGKETKPPARFSEAALVRELEANGVGRPSTYASTIETIVSRKYATREKRTLVPTDLGMTIVDFLTEKMDELFGVGFTAEMEEELDKIEEQGLAWTDMLSAFYERFLVWLAEAKGPPADVEKVETVLSLFEQVEKWAPPVKRGNRTRDDARFVESIRELIRDENKTVSANQFKWLVNILLKYRDQVPAAEEAAKSFGFDDLVERSANIPPPAASTIRKLDLLKNIELDKRDLDFIDSFNSRVQSGSGLSEKQTAVLDRIVVAHRAVIPGFESIRHELEIPENILSGADRQKVDPAVAPILEALGRIEKWNEPAPRGKGKRVFNDAEFFESISRQFKHKNMLTSRQIAALKRLFVNYKDAIPDFEEIAAKYDIRPSERSSMRRSRKGRGQASGTTEV